jgi:DNA-directed RNA polymerase specialized sigma24 family protein
MSLDSLIEHSFYEQERFVKSGEQDTRFAHEIFRRAFVEQNNDAWEHIFHQYRRLVERWVRRCGAFEAGEENVEELVISAFTRFWRSLTPERFSAFPSVAALLHYLRCCSTSVVIDDGRSRQRMLNAFSSEQSLLNALQEQPEDVAMDRLSRVEFWRLIGSRLNNEAERVVLFKSFLHGLRPADIFAEHPQLFRSIGDVYNIKRTVLQRLGRDPAVLRMR